MDFKMEIHDTKNEIVVISLEDCFDVYSAPHVKEKMEMIEMGKIYHVIDLTKVDYIDSTALRAMIKGQKQLRGLNGDLVLVCPTPKIRRVFKVTGLDKVFDIYDTVEEAEEAILSAINKPPPAA